MHVLLELPDADADRWIQRLRKLGLNLSLVVPDPTPALPMIPRHVAQELRETFAEIKAARNGGPPLLTEEQFWAGFHDESDDDDAKL